MLHGLVLLKEEVKVVIVVCLLLILAADAALSDECVSLVGHMRPRALFNHFEGLHHLGTLLEECRRVFVNANAAPTAILDVGDLIQAPLYIWRLGLQC